MMNPQVMEDSFQNTQDCLLFLCYTEVNNDKDTYTFFMASRQKRTVQTCSICDKTGHNKRRCSLVIKKTQKDVMGVKNIKSISRQVVDKKTVIDKESASIITALSSSSEPRTQKHYVPVIIGKSGAVSDHLVDLVNNKNTENFLLEEINLFREKLSETVERKTIDFATFIRASKKASSIKKKKKRMSRVFRLPALSIPCFPIRFSVPHFTLPKMPLFLQKPIVFSPIVFRRIAHALFILIIIIAIPLPSMSAYQSMREDSINIVSASTGAFASLQQSTNAAFQADIILAQSELQDALVQFNEVETLLNKGNYKIIVDIASALPIIGGHVASRRAIVNAGQQIALGNTYLIKGVSDAQDIGDMSMTERLSILTTHIERALPQYREARRNLVSVDTKILSKEQRELFGEFLILYSAFIDDMQDLANLSHILYDIFGGDAFRRYLVLFQNNHEIRPTGGFIGSFAIIDTQKGRIENIDIPGGGSYDIQGQFDKFIVPPEPLQLVNDRWEFQDVNWFFDFPTTARKAESFVSRARGITFDGTLAINASVIERLLRVIGPIALQDFDVLLDAEHILPTLQHHVESGYTRKEDEAPKEILNTVFKELLVALQTISPDQLISLLQELHEALGEKEIQIALKDNKSNTRLASFGWTGSILRSDPRQDYLAVVATNLQGQKSDARIVQYVEHLAEVQNDGSVIVRTAISRTHSGDFNEDLYGAANITYMRVYVPEGAVLLDAGGFTYPPEDVFRVPEDWYEEDSDLLMIEHEIGIHKKTGTRITNEFGKTSFGNWMITPPGESREIWFTYQLPFSVVDKKNNNKRFYELFSPQPDALSGYSLFVQKQSGVENIFSSTVIYPSGWEPRWKSLDAINFTHTGASFETRLDTDIVYGIVLEQHL